jgi:hypothetical protein
LFSNLSFHLAGLTKQNICLITSHFITDIATVMKSGNGNFKVEVGIYGFKSGTEIKGIW